MATVRRQIEVSNDVAAALSGSGDQILRALEQHVDSELFLRGNLVTLEGDAEAVAAAATVVRELADLVEQGHEIGPGTVAAVGSALAQHERPSEILEDVVWRHRSTRVAPKSVNQKRYVDSIRRNTITFGIGPAGTGKTFLAVAMAAAALARREVNRIILTRPAVEAGERLGFLPGDLMAKIDPYLRPLFDALNDMMDPEKVAGHLERGVIEVAPLAFMRGRAQPVDRKVLTPWGWQPIGSLEVGDLVIGSNGQPTPVLGVFPQGRRNVFEVRAQDGASTVCCAEHLWFVTTPDDRRHGKDGRVLRTDEMIGRLRRDHQHRYELPLVSEPVELVPCDVPMDPYALGLLLGDGCLTTTTTPSFTIADPELADALAPQQAAATVIAPAGAIPDVYLFNAPAVRHAVLQGLLDSEAATVGSGGRIACRTGSTALADDVVFLVRSFGGVAVRSGDALDIRLPAGVEPFRLTRKRETYAARGGGRPMRFIESIESAGEAETVCIQVGAQDSLYVTDDLLVTHNTLNDSFVILDEAQNTTPEQMKMFLTRLGFGSKMVVTGDITQVDLPRDQHSGLIVVSDILDAVEGVQFVRFGGDDVVRHQLVQRIVEAYDEHATRAAPELRPADRRRA
jgi:phosphate starvation-inducible PhoH-like protein